ncbi:hypothetical protein FUAX_53710 (plasmid) [Fulvitalea axinellae]|uniref:DUF3347 domain-containing protein n=1 Tax=Fulvitalea axinellae TaxID=1182444 RepID=A0AAU9D2X9_9BACT|nr:hypothetical protein FUAX_53710 [Fulvitalea axinellae]
MNITKRNFLALVIVLVSSVSYGWAQSCCSSGKKCGPSTALAMNHVKATGVSAKGLMGHYLKVKDALVKSDAKLAGAEAKKMQQYVSQNEAKNAKLNKAVKALTGATNLNAQRKAFSELSAVVYDIKKGKSGRQTIYRQYCSMAFNNTGGYWLSAEKQVNNPYFGDRMLHCGRVTEELK